MTIPIEDIVNTTGTSFSITTAGEDRALIVFIGGGNYTKPTSVKFNNIDLTKVKEQNNTTRYAAIWMLLDPPAGTYNIVLNANGGYRVSGVAVSDVDLTQGLVTTGGAGQGSTRASLTIAGMEVDDVMFAILGLRFDPGNIVINYGTGIYDDDVKHGSAYRVAVGTSTEIRWDAWAESQDWSVAGIVLRPKPLITTDTKSVSGVLRASIKSVNGILLASIKKILGLS